MGPHPAIAASRPDNLGAWTVRCNRNPVGADVYLASKSLSVAPFSRREVLEETQLVIPQHGPESIERRQAAILDQIVLIDPPPARRRLRSLRLRGDGSQTLTEGAGVKGAGDDDVVLRRGGVGERG